MRFLALGASACVLAALGQPLPPDATGALQPYGEFRSHALASWHPTKREILALHGVTGADIAHRVETPGAKPIPLAASVGATQAAWQPTRGDYFVFIAPGPDGVPRVQRYDSSTQSAAMVSPPGERATAFAWNPAGDRIVYSAAEPAGTRSVLRIVDPLRPETERRLARLDGNWTELSFAPGGRRIAATQVSDGESHLWQIGVATGTPRRVTRPDPKAPAHYANPQFSPDGSSLFALSDRGSEFRRLVLIPLAGGPERALTAHHRFDVDAFAVSADAGLAAFVTNESGAHVMRFLDLKTLKEQPRPSLLDGVIGDLAWRPGSREIGFDIASARTAGDVFSYDAKANQVTRWTNGNNPAVNTRDFAEPVVIRWKSLDGREVSGLYYRPPARFTGKRPVIVDHRTAPGAQARAGFLGRANYLVSELGVAIIRPNVRGASGFGKEFLAAGEGARREDARKDIAALLEWIGRQPDLDTARALVLGEGTDREMDDEAFLRAALDFTARGPNPVRGAGL